MVIRARERGLNNVAVTPSFLGLHVYFDIIAAGIIIGIGHFAALRGARCNPWVRPGKNGRELCVRVTNHFYCPLYAHCLLMPLSEKLRRDLITEPASVQPPPI